MTEILPLYAICAVLAYCSNYNSEYDFEKENYRYRERQFFTALMIAAIVFAGLRTTYNDTTQYINGYNELSGGTGWIKSLSWELGDYPLYNVMRHLMKMAGLSSQSFIMLTSVVTVGVPLWFIHKYSNNILLSVFLFFTIGVYGFSLAAIKQCLAIAFGLIAIDRFIENKKLSYVFWVVIACLFHPFAVLYFAVPFLAFRPWSRRTFILFACFALLGINLQTWLGTALDFVNLMGKDYDENNLIGEGVNLFRVAVLWSPVILSIITTKFWKENEEYRIPNLMMNLTVLNAELMFVAIFGNPVYFGRLANYFLVFQTISIPWLLQYFTDQSKRLVTGAVVIGYIGYLMYGMSNFDSGFYSVSLLSYLGNIFGG